MAFHARASDTETVSKVKAFHSHLMGSAYSLRAPFSTAIISLWVEWFRNATSKPTRPTLRCLHDGEGKCLVSASLHTDPPIKRCGLQWPVFTDAGRLPVRSGAGRWARDTCMAVYDKTMTKFALFAAS